MTLFRSPIFRAMFVVPLFLAAHSHAFTLIDTEGKNQRLADYKGKWVIVNHWATWCGPCLDELPALAEFAQDPRNKDMVVLSVVHDYESKEKIQKFAQRLRLGFPIVLGTSKAIKEFPAVKGIPTTFVYAPNGKLKKTEVGQLSQEEFEAMIEEVKK